MFSKTLIRMSNVFTAELNFNADILSFISPLITLGLGLAILLLCLCYFLGLYVYNVYQHLTDFGIFYSSLQSYLYAKRFYIDAHGFIFYDVGHVIGHALPNLIPPLWMLFLLPLGLLDYPVAYMIWIGFTLLAIVMTSRVIQQQLNLTLNQTLLLLVILLLLPTTREIFHTGQITWLLGYVLALAWRDLRHEKNHRAAFLLGCLFSIRTFFGLFLLYFLFKKQYRAAILMFTTFLLVIVLSIVLTGWDTFKDYIHVLGGVNWYSTSWNASFLGEFSRLFGRHESNLVLFDEPILTHFCSVVCSLGLLGFLIHFYRTRLNSSLFSQDIGFGLCLVSMLLLSPFGWVYYFDFLIIPFCIAFVVVNHYSVKRVTHFWLSLALISVFYSNRIYHPNEMTTVMRVLFPGSIYFVGLLAIFSVLWQLSSLSIPSPHYLKRPLNISRFWRMTLLLGLIVPSAMSYINFFDGLIQWEQGFDQVVIESNFICRDETRHVLEWDPGQLADKSWLTLFTKKS